MATDKVWIQICYFVEFQKNSEGMWTRKYVDDKENMIVTSVGKSISYDELYKKVAEKLEINSMLYELEMRCENHIPSNYPQLPMKIDCDESVEWLVAVSDRTRLNITLKKKVIGIEEPHVVQSGTTIDSLEESQNVVIDDAFGIGGDTHCLGEKSPRRDSAAVDPLLSSYGEGVQLYPWATNNIDDDGFWEDINRDECSDDGNFGEDIDSDDSSYDGNSGEDARENTPIENSLGGNSNGLNSHEDPIVNSPGTGSLDLIPSHPDSGHVSSVRIPENLNICEGDLFDSKGHLIRKLEMMALKAHFEFIRPWSTKLLFEAKCAVKECGWRVRAKKVNKHDPESEAFQVRIYKGNHSCSLSVRQKDHKHASYTFIGMHYLYKFRDVNSIYRAKDIIRDFREEFGYTIEKGRAYKAKRFALELIHGKASESYEKLPKYCHMLKVHNHGTKTFIRTNKKTGRFLYFFMALGASISGFKSSIRPVICVDGTHLKSEYRGTLLVATCQDANLQIFPLAWGVVNAEDNKSWTWFFQKLMKITGDTDEVVIVSDRASSIKRGFVIVASGFNRRRDCAGDRQLPPLTKVLFVSVFAAVGVRLFLLLV